ncbi:YceI family protein [Lutimonas sp.]|uniref:YceI family protein n=1 Tax=Lutimonas sp. TaxID=1872403 RepID=UPI003D9B6E99
MKKIIHFSLFLVIAISIIACGKSEKQKEAAKEEITYMVDAANSSVQWTGYKTTDKVPVKGTFKEINITESKPAATATSSLEGLTFEIPVSSIYSKDSIRDGKLKKFFFAIMENTLSLKGSFSIKDESHGNVAISMNGLTKDLPFTYEMSKDTIIINGKMDLNNWGAEEALGSLHEVCLELHTGADGISKTWDEVGIEAKILTVKK